MGLKAYEVKVLLNLAGTVYVAAESEEEAERLALERQGKVRERMDIGKANVTFAFARQCPELPEKCDFGNTDFNRVLLALRLYEDRERIEPEGH